MDAVWAYEYGGGVVEAGVGGQGCDSDAGLLGSQPQPDKPRAIDCSRKLASFSPWSLAVAQDLFKRQQFLRLHDVTKVHHDGCYGRYS